ncbi:uncharacterized protein LOC124672766 [Lolium rigidum]|uniref:uncharacterized protein LOC124672766 n=1 Tax=Lolium rigidum TaxID=89674 RepID=UPI001F5DE7AA|nr:uncharacterized protein LOC124672766 [Lolium rigidum]
MEETFRLMEHEKNLFLMDTSNLDDMQKEYTNLCRDEVLPQKRMKGGYMNKYMGCVPVGEVLQSTVHSPHLSPTVRDNRTRRRHPALPPAALEDDDLLRKIFLLLPPQPSALPRLSVVCKQWRAVVTDPQFLRGFRDHHKKPPLLGLVMGYTGFPYFRSDLDPPDHIPHERFFPPSILDLHMDLFDCRHGRVLFYDHARYEVFVWDPATRDRHCAVVPPLFDEKEVGAYNGAVLCTARHVHGDCHSSPFQAWADARVGRGAVAHPEI